VFVCLQNLAVVRCIATASVQHCGCSSGSFSCYQRFNVCIAPQLTASHVLVTGNLTMLAACICNTGVGIPPDAAAFDVIAMLFACNNVCQLVLLHKHRKQASSSLHAAQCTLLHVAAKADWLLLLPCCRTCKCMCWLQRSAFCLPECRSAKLLCQCPALWLRL
jgi:hypothetical protein